jgi:CRISPR-associated endoribonuclease Cas6
MNLITLTLKFFFYKGFTFNYFSGYYVRGFFYSALRKSNPELAEKIHNSKVLAPFSSRTIFLEQPNGRQIVFNKVSNPSPAFFEYSIFNEEVSRSFLEHVIQEGSVTLLNEKFPLSHIDMQEIDWNSFIESSKPVKKFDIVFLTPTYFRLPPVLLDRYGARLELIGIKEKAPYRYYPLPDPSLLIRSIAKTWRAFSPVKLNLTSLISWVGAGGIAVSGYPSGVRTYRLYEHEKADKWVVGFTGRVGFSVPNDLFDESLAKNLDVLLRFSKFSNVGGGRTAGLGMVEYIPLEYAKDSEG